MRQWIKQQIERRWGIVIVDRAEYLRISNNASYLSMLQDWAEETGIELPSHHTLSAEAMRKVFVRVGKRAAENVFEKTPLLTYLRQANAVKEKV
jgi:hypothetical protein|tara:strand:+ start:1985 stop:2266 length:282 start_codon:yes stop_codon:yes gene_type:complete